MELDFHVHKFYTYTGPNFYLDRRSIVFNLSLNPEGETVGFYEDVVFKAFPALEALPVATNVAEFFAMTVLHLMKMDIDLFIDKYAISRDEEEWVIAIEFLDEKIAVACIKLVRDWFRAIDKGEDFDIMTPWVALQGKFDRTLFGGPTIYSLYEAGLKRDIPVHFLFTENQFQWGYGKKQIRGRSTTFHVDGIKDTEFTMYKDMCGDFLQLCGFPTPRGENCFEEDEAVEVAIELGYPVVVKPVAGHKGQGVVTGIMDEAGVRKAFQNVINLAAEQGVEFDGALVQKMIFGMDHRLLTVGGKFAAALERVPAYVDGDGKSSIEELIIEENKTVARIDNARSPLCKIKIDADLKDYLKLQDLELSSVPAAAERIYLRRVANISAGGVSINVTPNIHPLNVKMVEDIAAFFNVTCLGIDVLTEDISQPWTAGNFGIIEINAGPGVFMHLAPAIGESIDVPGLIMAHHFHRPEASRIPIITGNKISTAFAEKLMNVFKETDPKVFVGALTPEGIHFDGKYFHKDAMHDQNIKIILRHPKLDIAILQHSKDDIYDFGTWHEGADLVILENPDIAEEILARDMLPGAYYFEVEDEQILLHHLDQVTCHPVPEDSDKESVLLNLIRPLVPGLLELYA